MSTRTLELQELDYDNLPIDGTNIVYFNSSTSFGMFEQHYTQQGKVVYMYGDIADTLEDAIAAGGYVSIAKDDLEGSGDLDIPLCVESENSTLYKGCLWIYEHNYLPVLDDHYFPFQDWEYFQIALEQGWCTKEDIEDRSYIFTEYGKDVNWDWKDMLVEFNRKTFKVTWVKANKHSFYLQGYEVVKEKL